MINYEYLQYWVKTIEDIDLLEKLLIENLFDYFRTREVEHLEYIINNANEIPRLNHLKGNIIEKHFMKDNKISNETKITRTKIAKKVRKIWKKLRSLYIEYELSQLVKTDNDKKDQLINIISKTEYKYVRYLKKQYEQRNL